MTFINGQYYWRSRTPVKHGMVQQAPGHPARFGEASTAKRRQEDRVWDRKRQAKHVQILPGVLVIWDRKPYQVLEVREIPGDRWGEGYESAFEQALELWEGIRHPRRGERPQRATWGGRPVSVVVVPAASPETKPVHLRCPANHQWDVLPEHYAVCHACGELPPCTHEINEERIEQELAHAEELMFIQPGCCHGCGEPVTTRQKTTRFPGPNLWRPDLGNNSAVFHSRQECADDLARYRKHWQTKGSSGMQEAFPERDGAE
jgi:hypothetical protein